MREGVYSVMSRRAAHSPKSQNPRGVRCNKSPCSDVLGSAPLVPALTRAGRHAQLRQRAPWRRRTRAAHAPPQRARAPLRQPWAAAPASHGAAPRPPLAAHACTYRLQGFAKPNSEPKPRPSGVQSAWQCAARTPCKARAWPGSAMLTFNIRQQRQRLSEMCA